MMKARITMASIVAMVFAATVYAGDTGSGGTWGLTEGAATPSAVDAAGVCSADIDLQGNLLYDSTDALELGTACTDGATGDVCCGGDLYVEGNVEVYGQGSYQPNTVVCDTDTDDFDIDWDNGNIAHLDLEACDQDANDVNAPTNPVNNASYIIAIENSAAGTEDLTWNAVFLFPGGVDPVNTQSANGLDIISCVYVNSLYYCGSAMDMQ